MIDTDELTQIGEMFGLPVYLDKYMSDLEYSGEFMVGFKSVGGDNPGMVWLPYVKAEAMKNAKPAPSKVEPSFILCKMRIDMLTAKHLLVRMAIAAKCPKWFDKKEEE